MADPGKLLFMGYLIGDDTFAHLERGKACLKVGRFAEAETEFRQAIQKWRRGQGNADTAWLYLGRALRKQGRVAEAIEAAENALPLPAAFKDLISLFREQSSMAKKAKDRATALLWLNRMLSVAFIQAKVRSNRYDAQVAAMSALRWDYLNRFGTLYPYVYERDGTVPDSTLLSSRDYASLHRLTFEEADD